MSTTFEFRKPRPRMLRIWHWLDAVVILGSLGTVLLRKTFLSWRTNSQLIEAQVHELGGSISAEGSVTLAKALRAPMWEWHYIFGFTLVGLLVLRFVLGLVRPEQAPFRSTWRALTEYRTLDGAQKKAAWHYMTVKAVYALFYAVLTVMVVLGLLLYFGASLGIAEGTLEIIKETHESMMWFFVVFIAMHVGGVVVAELRGERGLVSDMIHGGEAAAKER